jgi:hypothetical protein
MALYKIRSLKNLWMFIPTSKSKTIGFDITTLEAGRAHIKMSDTFYSPFVANDSRSTMLDSSHEKLPRQPRLVDLGSKKEQQVINGRSSGSN